MIAHAQQGGGHTLAQDRHLLHGGSLPAETRVELPRLCGQEGRHSVAVAGPEEPSPPEEDRLATTLCLLDEAEGDYATG